MRRLLSTLVLLAGCKDMEVPILVGDWCDDPRSAQVACTIDGDTVDLDDCGEEGERVRMLGVDAPEDSSEESECYGSQATNFVDTYLTGLTTTLEFDLECLDTYDRTLAWIEVDGDEDDALYPLLWELDMLGIDEEEGTFEVLFNELIIRAGYATFYDEAFAKDVRYRERLEDAEAAAEADHIGLWSECEE